METETQQTVRNNEPIIAVPTHVEPNLPPQPTGSSVPETILAIALLIRSVALLIQAIGQHKGRK